MGRSQPAVLDIRPVHDGRGLLAHDADLA